MTVRSLLVVRSLPRPANGGADLRAQLVATALARHGPTAVFALHGEREPPPAPDGVELWETSTVEGLTASTVATLDWIRAPGGHPSDAWFAPAAAADLAALAERLRPDVCVFDHLWLHRYVDVVRCLKVLNSHNVEGPLQAAIADTHGARLPKLIAARTHAIEEAMVRAVDQVWVCSDLDADTLARSYPCAAPAAVVPNAVDVGAYPAPTPQDGVVIFPAVFSYPPNALAATFLVERVLPLLADMTLLLVGRDLPPGLLVDRVAATGAVADVRPYLARAFAMAVPLFEGGGTRFKILEAFAARVPVVTTRKGAEGIDVEDGRDVLFAETPEEFATQLSALPAVRDALTANAYELVRSRYSYEAVEGAVTSSFAQLRAAR